MISLLGRTAILIALSACVIGLITGIVAGLKRNDRAWKWSRWMAYVFAGASTIGIGLMEYALITHDFSVSYVAEVGSTQTPLWVTIVSLWSSLDGSILLWCFVLSLYTALFARMTANKYPEHSPWALGITHGVGVFFAFLVSGVANPFAPAETLITEGPGPNPLLQNHILMVIHPPALYLGYVGMAVPFGMGCAALLAGKIGAAWSAALRRWVLVPWGFLTVGILLGGWWSYEVLGWGGYWAWDPVENASFLPWLTATAFIHSTIMMERKDQLKGWAIVLVLSTFLLTLLGTFMTRSGVFNSVHSFTQTPIGPVFLAFLGFCSVVSLLLLAMRIDVLSPPSQTEKKPAGIVSRDTMFLLNNLLFAAFTFTVLIGTVYPLINEAMTQNKLSIGEPYFNELGVPISMGIIFLMGVGPALPWGQTRLDRAFKSLSWPMLCAFLAAGVALGFGAKWDQALLSFALCGFALATTAQELLRPALRRSKSKGESFIGALWTVSKKARRRTGGYIVHLGVILVAIAVTGSSAYKEKEEFLIRTGEQVEFHGYQLIYDGARTDEQPHRSSRVAMVRVLQDGTELGTLEPRLNNYHRMQTTIGTPAVKTTLGQDLYLSLVKIDEDNDRIGLQVIIEPLVFWLWFGGGIMGLGTLISAWPSRRKSNAKSKEAVA
ncbi:MAG: heme lyase CcmF/NrfE family subunit [Myxococcota bacterium]